MSSKKLQIGNEIFDYPIVGSSNYGEEATAWAEAATAVLAEVKSPGDISITERTLSINNTDPENPFSTFSIGLIDGLQFNTSFVQRISIVGLITRKYSGKPQEVESFTIEGAYNAVEFNFSQVFAGDDTELEFSESSGQFFYKFKNDPELLEVSIKFQAKTVIDQKVLE
jgi:hypothetical protein